MIAMKAMTPIAATINPAYLKAPDFFEFSAYVL